MFTENLATTVTTPNPSDHSASRSHLRKLVLLVIILGVTGALVGWLLYTRLVQPRTSVTLNELAQVDPHYRNETYKYSVTIPEGWTRATIDPTKMPDPNQAAGVEFYDPVLGQGEVVVVIAATNFIRPEEEGRLQSGTFNNLPARTFEEANPFGGTDRIYYLTHTAIPYLRITVRSNKESTIEQKLAELESSFTLIQ